MTDAWIIRVNDNHEPYYFTDRCHAVVYIEQTLIPKSKEEKWEWRNAQFVRYGNSWHLLEGNYHIRIERLKHWPFA